MSWRNELFFYKIGMHWFKYNYLPVQSEWILRVLFYLEKFQKRILPLVLDPLHKNEVEKQKLVHQRNSTSQTYLKNTNKEELSPIIYVGRNYLETPFGGHSFG